MPETRSILDSELAGLNAKILRLASMVDSAIEKAMMALTTRDLTLARTVVANDELINALRLEIEEETLRILATQQPFAVDLRETITAIHLANELERMGDQPPVLPGWSNVWKKKTISNRCSSCLRWPSKRAK